MPQIRAATVRDIPRLCELLQVLFSQEAEFRPDAARQVEGLRQIIEHPEIGHILVLCDRDSILGMVNILFTISTALGGRVALLEDMVVDPDRRGRGAGSQLLQAAIAFARDAGCLRITLLTDRANEAAQRFYRRHGFADSTMLPLRLMLDDKKRT